ncbi:MAG: hypothetical protein C0601_01965 [Candidatus Muiribacterium halophilum]|uniref:Uncharacterized protein n=1 Tax=Muiribacterium halophilum TaxID=2053465 RepID=A0A2N5ZL16_MUIH1|nr:MAG: hypothetical protein C0601_01965 [Candidatus Muirbacterium halophilum]
MENKQTILVWIIGVILLGLVMDLIIIPVVSGNYDIDSLIRIIKRDTEGVMSKTKVEQLSENPNDLKKEIEKILKNINEEKLSIETQIDQKKQKIEKMKKNILFSDFNYTDFDQKLNDIISENNFDMKIGIPQTDIDVERMFTFDDQSTKVKKVKVKYQEITYPIMQVDFLVLRKFIDEINKYKMMPLSKLEISRYDDKDGFVDASITFLIIKHMIGITKTNKEVAL